jgi:hypothetical protein
MAHDSQKNKAAQTVLDIDVRRYRQPEQGVERGRPAPKDIVPPQLQE